MFAPHPQQPFVIRQVRLDGAVIWLDAEGAADSCACPACGGVARPVHDRYVRRPLDVPSRGTPTRLALTVHRFRCPNPACGRRTFAEPFGPALARCARRTAAATALLLQVACALGGEAGARLAHRLGLPVSPDTLFRVLGHVEPPLARHRGGSGSTSGPGSGGTAMAQCWSTWSATGSWTSWPG